VYVSTHPGGKTTGDGGHRFNNLLQYSVSSVQSLALFRFTPILLCSIGGYFVDVPRG